MTSVRAMSLFVHTTLLCAALAFSACTVSAQNTAASDNSNATGNGWSSSTVLPAEDAGTPAFGALPAAPDPKGGAGQYDNRSRGGGGGGVMSHITYEAGGGFNAPTSDSSPYISWGGSFTVGAGYRFNRNFSTLLEYQFMDDKLPGTIIAQAGATGGHVHLWSLTADPMYEFNPKSAIGFYAIGGFGFYRSVTSFTDPEQSQYCTYFYCGVVTQNVVVGHYSSNQGGWSIGGGLEHRFAGWNGDGKTRVFAEARYLDVLTPAITTQANGLGTTTVGSDTKVVPVTFGVRF